MSMMGEKIINLGCFRVLTDLKVSGVDFPERSGSLLNLISAIRPLRWLQRPAMQGMRRTLTLVR